MEKNFTDRLNNMPLRGGLIGAILGALTSVKSHEPGDKPLRKAGKIALFSGIGFLLCNWIENKMDRKS